MEIAWVRTIFVIILFLSYSVVLLCDKAHANGILGKFLEAFEKVNSSNNPKSSKSKKDKKVKSASKDSQKKDDLPPSNNALAVGGYDVLKFGMSADEINKKTSCNLEAATKPEELIPGIDVLVCRNFSFDNQPAEAYFAFVDGMLQGLTINIPFDKNELKSLSEKCATKYGVPTSVSPTSDFEAWEKGNPDAKICFVYPTGAIRLSFLISESGEPYKIIIIYSSEKLIQLIDAEDAREAKEDAAIKLSADFNVDPITGVCPLEVHFENKSLGCQEVCWNFGDGEKSVETDPTHIYSKPGTYIAKLVVGNKIATDEATKIVQVLSEELSAGFVSIPTRGVAPLAVQFTDSSRGGPEKWYWDFGDGSGSDQQSPVHVFNKPGTYTVSLKVSNTTTQSVEKKVIRALDSERSRDIQISAQEDRDEMVRQAKRAKWVPTKGRVLDEWWDEACKELMTTRKYFSEKEIYEVMFIISGNAIARLKHAYQNKNNGQDLRDRYAASYIIACEANDVIRCDYEQKSVSPEFSKITYYTREYNTGLMKPRPQ